LVFSDTSAKNGIVQFTESLCKLGDAGITGDSVLFKQITSYLNQAYKKVAIAILRVDRNWKWDDTNYSDFPIATIDLVSGQRDYTLPAAVSGGNASTLWQIDLVEIMDSQGDYYEIHLMEYGDNENTDTGNPTKYNVIGNSIRLQPIPLSGSVTLTAGLRIRFKRSIVEFTTASTTEQPGFIDTYHDLLAYDAASTYLMPFNRQLALDYKNDFAVRLKELQSDWLNRIEKKTFMRGKIRNYD
jgi:hypothetical protein